MQVKHARTGTNRKRKRKVDYEEESDEEEAVPFACKKCGKFFVLFARFYGKSKKALKCGGLMLRVVEIIVMQFRTR